ncbi:MAG TPA: MFS transporter [Nitrososphaerales archaeon]|nr:MFS transporter [Nitrososphaerales archaeon]
MEYKWKALSVTSIGALMSAVDSTVVLLALFPMAEDLHSDFVTMTWVIVAYLLVNTALVLSFGRLADMFGRKLMYNIGFVIFTIGSALCGLAPNGLSLVAFRVIQGTGASLLTANAFAILSEAFPRNENGRAFGLMSIVWGIGSVLGIILGGIIITYTTWRLIFLINLPIGIFATAWAYKTLKGSKPLGQRGSFDVPAAVAFTLGLLSLLLGISWGLLYSWSDFITLAALALSPVFFILFSLWETRFSKDPILNFDFFRNRNFAFSIVAALLQFLAVFSVNFLLIFYLEGISGLSALESSYLIIPFALAAAIVGPVGGILSDRFGFRAISSSGLILTAVALVLFSRLTVSTSLLEIGIIETISGIGLAFFWPANTSAIMSSTPPAKYGVGSGIMITFRNTGMILSFALSLTAATSVIPPNVVYQLFIGNLSGKLSPTLANSYLSGESFAFEISAVLLVISLVFTMMTGRKKATVISEGVPAKESHR